MRIAQLFVAAAVLCTAGGAQAEWEGALGLALHHGPEIVGADSRRTRAEPVFFLRSGRFSISNASGFVTQGNDEVPRGLGIELARDERYELSLGLRLDRGRDEAASPLLRGLGEVRGTLRARVAGIYKLDRDWRATLAVSIDALNRDGGSFGELIVRRHLQLSAAQRLDLGASLSYATDRYHQSWFGVSAEQAARSGYPVFVPGSGWRDTSLFLSWRSQIAPRWVGQLGGGVTRLLGPAHQSPITQRRVTVGVNAGLAWTF